MKTFVWSLAVAASVMVTGVAQAQPGGGRGGFGGGFGGGRGGAGADAMLIGQPEVQKELGITEDQKVLVGEMLEDLRAGGQRIDFAALRDLSEDERRAKFEEFRKQGEERAKQAEDALKAILDEKQFARYSELRLQRQGPNALLRPEVSSALSLTQEQKDKLNEILEANAPRRGGPGGPGQGGPGRGPRPDGEAGGNRPPRGEGGPRGERPDFEALRAEMEKRREKVNNELTAVLTPEQKAQWEKMLGAKFNFPAPNFGGPGRRGPGQDGPGRGPRPE